MYGSWFAQLLPFVEQQSLYSFVMAEITASGENQPIWTSPPSYSSGSVVTQQYNGHSYTYTESSSSGGSGQQINGIWIEGAHQATFKILQCGSDPSSGGANGLVYSYWGYTNYLANFNAFAPVGNDNGVWASPVPLTNFVDGTSNTVLYGEGYANCDSIGRIALYSWYYHNFGLDWYQEPNTYMFQTNPPVGLCNNWVAQAGHPSGMNVCLADGSVRVVSSGISQQTWTNAMLPADGMVLGTDW